MSKVPEIMDAVFAILVDAAVKGERCPTSEQLTYAMDRTDANKWVSELAKVGRIRVEVSAHNWRVVEIREGEHKGKRTAPNPIKGAKPYMIVDRGGMFYPGRRASRW